MSKRKPNNDSGLSSMIDEVLQGRSSEERKVVDIITFCEDPAYLDFGGQNPPITLWPMQKIVLKMFYRGSRGNEHVELTEEEMDILRGIAKDEDLDRALKPHVTPQLAAGAVLESPGQLDGGAAPQPSRAIEHDRRRDHADLGPAAPRARRLDDPLGVTLLSLAQAHTDDRAAVEIAGGDGLDRGVRPRELD